MDPQEKLRDMKRGLTAARRESPSFTTAFDRMDGAVYVDGAISRRHKELMAVAVSVATRCSHCVAYHVARCYDAGATREEILEAAQVGVAFGGSPSFAYMGAVLMPALDEFED